MLLKYIWVTMEKFVLIAIAEFVYSEKLVYLQ